MSLDWNIEKVDDWEELADDDWERVVTQAIVFMSIPVGIHKITESNWREFWRRANVIEEKDGSTYISRYVDGVRHPYWLRPADVKRRIGLGTNVSTISRKKFDGEWAK